jgi:hypothetical protein
VYPSEFGIKAYKKKQEKSYLQDSWLKKIGNAKFRLETNAFHIQNFLNSFDWS